MNASTRQRARGRRRGLRRVLRWTMLLAVVGAGSVGWFWWQEPSAAAVRPQTVSVARGDVSETVLAAGVLESSRLVSVGAQVSGIVETLHVALGDEVQAGDLVAEIDRLDQENALLSAQAQLAQLQAQRLAQAASHGQAAHALARAQGLQDRGAITTVDYEAAALAEELARAQLAQIDAQIQQAEVTIGTAQLNLDRTRITAPISGTVVAVVVSQGQTLNAQSSAPTVIKIADLDTMLIKAEISEADVIRVMAGQRVWFTVMGEPDRRIEAELASVAPAPASIADSDEVATNAAVYYNGIFEVENSDHRLRIAMNAEVTIVLDEAQDALIVPAAAVTTGRDGTTTVQVYDPRSGAIRVAAVETGLDDNVSVQILSGVEEGDEIVIAGGTSRSGGASAGGMGGRPGGMGFPGM